ncbi:HECT domain and RCC1-like domain-containing protein, partial [Reticulomyxa filosa]
QPQSQEQHQAQGQPQAQGQSQPQPQPQSQSQPQPQPEQQAAPLVNGDENKTAVNTPQQPQKEEQKTTSDKSSKNEDRYIVEPIFSELQVMAFSELPDFCVARDIFLKYIFLTPTQKDKASEKAQSQAANDKGTVKEELKNEWKELFQKILIGEKQEEAKDEGNLKLTREELVNKITSNEDTKEMLSSLCEQFEINNANDLISLEKLFDILTTLIGINPKLLLDWVFENGYDHNSTKRFHNSFEIALAEQYSFQEKIVQQYPHFDALFLKHCNQIAEKLGFHSLQQLRPVHVRHVSPEEVQSDPTLRDLLNLKPYTPVEMLRLRFSAFQCLNAVIAQILPFVDLSNYETPSSLAHLLCIVGDNYIFTKVKTDFLQNVMDATCEPVEKKAVVRMNRMKLLNKMSTIGSLDFATESNFGFGYQQLSRVDNSQLRPPKPQGADPFVAFVLELIGQFVEGDTGPYRQYFSDVSSELQSPESYLFHLTPNGRKPQLDLMNKDKYIIRPSHPSLLLSATGDGSSGAVDADPKSGATEHDGDKQRVSEGLNIQSAKDSANLKEEQFGMFEFLGKLIGMCLRTGVKLNLSLPAFFWKPLVGISCGRKDLYEIDTALCKGLEEIWNYPTEKKNLFENEIKETFMTTLSDMTLVELKPNGSQIPVNFENRREYVSLVYQVRLNEHMPHIECIRRGIHKIVPIHVLSLFTWQELERLICGVPDVNIDLLRRHTIYDKDIDPDSDYIKWFWEILHSLSPENKRKFVRFTWAQERLPNDDEEFARLRLRFLIKPVMKSGTNVDQLLPKAHTCFFHLELPKYSNKEVMKERLLLAITETLSINADEPGRDDLNQDTQPEDEY